MEADERARATKPNIAAIMASLIAHQQTQRSTHVIRRSKRNTSNWKWLSRWERLRK